jgi:acetoin utilization deacetylase AcuC-like enzyme
VKVFYTDQFVLPLPEGHRFPMQKYRLLRERVMAAGIVALSDMLTPAAASDEEIERAHDPHYRARVQTGRLSEPEIRRIGFPWSPEMVERSRRSSGATIQACRAALTDGIAVNLAGGTHHAFRSCGEGFCIFKDSAIAARAVQAEGLVKHIIVIDCDVHQGNGTAAIFADDLSVFTYSIHGAKNFPLRKEMSDLDVGLPDGAADHDYLSALEPSLRSALGKAKPDLAIFLAGADPYAGDRFGRLALTKKGLAERDRLVFDLCQAMGLPIAVTMAGGYAREIDDIVDIHFETVRAAAERAC